MQNDGDDTIATYRKGLFTSENGRKTAVWGPPLWDYLFIMIMGRYPIFYHDDPELADIIVAQLENLTKTMPCGLCRGSYTKILATHPIGWEQKSSRNHMLYWLFCLKNKVNDHLDKKPVLSFLDVLEDYNKKTIVA